MIRKLPETAQLLMAKIWGNCLWWHGACPEEGRRSVVSQVLWAPQPKAGFEWGTGKSCCCSLLRKHTHTHTRTHTHAHTHECLCVHIHVLQISLYIHIYIYMYLYISIYVCLWLLWDHWVFLPPQRSSLWEHGTSGNLGVFESACHPTPEAFFFLLVVTASSLWFSWYCILS